MSLFYTCGFYKDFPKSVKSIWNKGEQLVNAILKTILSYALLVVLPTTTCCTFLFIYHQSNMEKKNKREARIIADLYKDNLDRFIGEAISALETLAMVVNRTNNDSEQIQEILNSVDKRDARFSGFYYAQTDGVIYLASHPITKTADVSDRPYIQEALKTQKTVLSPPMNGRMGGKNVIVAATPVIDKKIQTTGIVMASLRLDYASDMLTTLKPEYHFEVSDLQYRVFLKDKDDYSTEGIRKVTIALDKAPWYVSVYPLPINKTALYQQLLAEGLFVLFLTNVLFLLLKYALLKRQTQKERRENEAQKLELIGTLAASTAHEIRNPLTGIKGLVALLSEKYTGEQDQMYFSVIQKEIERINEIVSEFLILGKPTAIAQQIYDLRHIVSEVSLIIQSEANLHSVYFSTVLGNHPVLIRCSKDQIKQVILNITKNAFEAMKTHDSLLIEVKPEGRFAQLRITDTGTGIPEEVQQKIFDPFFTSKATGTGLGLVVCKRIVDMYNGDISITSSQDKGTQVTISLPLYTEI
jgi:two-component system, sporulation sensor kinase D